MWGTFVAILLALRLLTPTGFMPAFDHGSVTIVACPDAQASPSPMAAHHHGHSKQFHQPCPYASASGLGFLVVDFAALIGPLIVAGALLLARNFPFVELRRAHERPPPRGPPVPA